MEEYLDANPAALANRIVHHYDLSRTTAGQVRSILSDPRKHELGSALLAIASALVFGLGLGRVLQLVHTRAWQITLPNRGSDRARYAAVLLGLYGLIFALLAQLDVLGDGSSWMDLTALPLWVALLTVFFTWSPRFLTHKRLEWRDLLPSAVLTATGLVTLMVISTYVMERWVDFYAQDYGGLGVVMAIFFWIELSAGIIVWAASLSPALAARRRLRADRFASS
jgi:uncharacterized BrkB/YihY/UPF0761 family membrane protein